MRYSIVIVLLFSFSLAFSQKGKNTVIINSNEYIEKGIEKFDNSEWEEAEKLFKSVPVGDTLYNVAQYELAYSYQKQLRFDEAFSICYRLLQVKDERLAKSSVYTELANCYSENDQWDKAIQIYDSALVFYPYNYQLYFNKGIVYQKKEVFDSAILCFEKAIFCCPEHQRSHYQLGMSYIRQGYYIPGILALNYAAMLYPSKREALLSLQALSELYVSDLEQTENTHHPEMTSEMEKRNERYKKLETLVRSEFALNKKYKLKSSIDHLIVRQNQFIFENIEQNLSSSYIEDQLYIPFFKRMVKDKKTYDLFNHLIFSNTDLENGAVMKRAKKMEKEMNQIWTVCLEIMKEAMSKGIGIDNKEKNYFEYKDFKIIAFGSYKTDSKGKQIENGHWYIFNANGSLSKEGDYKEGKADGKWIHYDVYGNITQEYNQRNDTILGMAYIYFDRNKKENSKLLSKEIPFKNGTINGIRNIYNRSGVLIERANWENDFYNGEFLRNYSQGMPKNKSTYDNGELVGTSIEYYPNGEVKDEYVFNEKNVEGNAIIYYPGSKIETKGKIMNRMAVGEWMGYFYTGEINYKMYYNNEGKENGIWYFYNRNGTIERQHSFNNGKKQGEEIYNNSRGKLLFKNIFKNGTLSEVITYYPDGRERERITASNKQFVVKIYSNDSVNDYLQKEVSYNLKGDKDGKFIEYAPNGNIVSMITYKNNKQEGTTINYYPNGKVMSYFEMANDNYDGLYRFYYENDTLSYEGIFSEGEKDGAWYSYYFNGNSKSIEIYNNKVITYECEYFVNGIKSNETIYSDGLPISKTFYNEKGEEIKKLSFENGNGYLYDYYLNGNPKSKVKILAGEIMDTCYWFGFDGKLLNKIQCISGEYYGTFLSFDNNTVNCKSNYLMSKEMDSIVYFNFDGGVSLIYKCELGQKEGEMIKYYDDGKLCAKGNYIADVREGVFTYYAVDGNTIIYQLMYNHGQIIAYAFMDKNREMTDFIPITKEKVEIISYYSNGIISNKVIFENGLRQGIEYSYYPDGKIFEEVNFIDNEYHGSYKQWNQNGKLTYENNFLYGYQNGNSTYYYENGNVKRQADYVYGFLNGSMKQYDKNGKVTAEQQWFYGERLK